MAAAIHDAWQQHGNDPDAFYDALLEIEKALFRRPLTIQEELVGIAPFLASKEELVDFTKEKAQKLVTKRMIKEIISASLPNLDPTLISVVLRLFRTAQTFGTEEDFDSSRPRGLVESAVKSLSYNL